MTQQLPFPPGRPWRPGAVAMLSRWVAASPRRVTATRMGTHSAVAIGLQFAACLRECSEKPQSRCPGLERNLRHPACTPTASNLTTTAMPAETNVDLVIQSHAE